MRLFIWEEKEGEEGLLFFKLYLMYWNFFLLHKDTSILQYNLETAKRGCLLRFA